MRTRSGIGGRTADAATITPAPNPTGRRALVAEDNLVNQTVVVRLLQRLGWVVDVASDGREAIQRCATRAYDVILMDCQMPDLDGFDATREIRRREGSLRRIPIVALTAHALPGDREACLAAGMDEYLSKPVSADALRAALERVLSGTEVAVGAR